MTVKAHKGGTKGFWAFENLFKSLSQVPLIQPEPTQLSNCGDSECSFYKTEVVVSIISKIKKGKAH